MVLLPVPQPRSTIYSDMDIAIIIPSKISMELMANNGPSIKEVVEGGISVSAVRHEHFMLCYMEWRFRHFNKLVVEKL